MAQVIKIIVEREDVRIDKIITDAIEDLTRSAVQNLIKDGHVTFNGNVVPKNAKLSLGDEITLRLPDAKELEVKAENIPLCIEYEDEDLLVVNKPKDMVVHPAPGNDTGTLVNALLYHCKDSLSGINGVIRPGIVHRIDKDTSGLLVIAKNDFSHTHLAEQIKEHTFQREYEAVIYGHLKDEKGTVCARIGRDPSDRKKMAVLNGNKPARDATTHYTVVKYFDGFTHVKLRLETGRTHQIRVHMSYIGHPVAGDPLYGPKKVITSLKGQCLHARTIGFVHPRTQEYMEFHSPLPDYFTGFISTLKEAY